jgi:hypothetical protein
LNLADADTALSAGYRPAIERLQAIVDNITRGPKGAEGPIVTDAFAAILAILLWKAEFERVLTSGKMVRDWFVARFAATNKGDALDEKDLQRVDRIKESIIMANNQAIHLEALTRQQKHAFLDVTMPLLKDLQNGQSENETRLQHAAVVPGLVDASVGSSSRSGGGKKKGKTGRTRRRS